MNSKKQSIQIFFENKAGDLAENCGVRFLDYELSKNYISLKILSSSSVLLVFLFNQGFSPQALFSIEYYIKVSY